MPITFRDFKNAQVRFPTLANIGPTNPIRYVKVTIPGISGGTGRNKHRKINYTLIIDVRDIRSGDIPEVYVLDPPESKIFHINIYPPKYCSFLNRELPYICWGTGNNSFWRSLENEKHQRTLYFLMDQLYKYFQQPQNPDSPARKGEVAII